MRMVLDKVGPGSRLSTVRDDKMLVTQLLQNRRETVPQLKNWFHTVQCASIKKICKTTNEGSWSESICGFEKIIYGSCSSKEKGYDFA